MQVEPRHVALALEVVDNSLHDGLIVPLLFGTQRESALYDINASANTSEPQQSTERIDSIEGKDSKCART
jgi:hypothetical protein